MSLPREETTAGQNWPTVIGTSHRRRSGAFFHWHSPSFRHGDRREPHAWSVWGLLPPKQWPLNFRKRFTMDPMAIMERYQCWGNHKIDMLPWFPMYASLVRFICFIKFTICFSQKFVGRDEDSTHFADGVLVAYADSVLGRAWVIMKSFRAAAWWSNLMAHVRSKKEASSMRIQTKTWLAKTHTHARKQILY
jgi:hypothetical protein